MTQTIDKPATSGNNDDSRPRTTAIVPARLPYPPFVFEAFQIDKGSWKALVEAIFPNATSTESVVLALSYCRARKLDVFKRNVHIVPIWDKVRKCMVDTIWPGIGELRTTAFRTGEYAGRDKTLFGPDVKMKVGSREMVFPEWAQVTVRRMVKGVRVAFAGPEVWWLETYASYKRDDDTPNEMWGNRPRGQIAKCAEAAALRAAFPEEIGSDYINDEVRAEGTGPAKTVVSHEVSQTGSRAADLANELRSRNQIDQSTGEVTTPQTGQQTDARESSQNESATAVQSGAEDQTTPAGDDDQSQESQSQPQGQDESKPSEADLIGIKELIQQGPTEFHDGCYAAALKQIPDLKRALYESGLRALTKSKNYSGTEVDQVKFYRACAAGKFDFLGGKYKS